MTRVIEAASTDELEQVRRLIRGFLAWHRERHLDDLHLIEAYFDDAAFEAELDGLPGKYAPPRGRLLLALVHDEPAGCVALREIDAGSCEMKRMFVWPHMQGRGAGRALGEAVVGAARDIGYRRMLLDTSVRQVEALTLYERLGFREIPPYYDVPQELLGWLVFRELRLDREGARA